MDKLIKAVKKDVEKKQPIKAKKDIKILMKADKKQDKMVADCKMKKKGNNNVR